MLELTSPDPGVSVERIARSLTRVLNSNSLCSIATIDERGGPYINTCFYSFNDDPTIFVFTSPGTKHGRNLERNRTCAVNVFSSSSIMGEDLLGAQIHCSAVQLMAAQGLAAFQNYCSRFPTLLTWANSWDAVLKGLQSRFYALTPVSGKILDEVEFGKEMYIEFSCFNS